MFNWCKRRGRITCRSAEELLRQPNDIRVAKSAEQLEKTYAQHSPAKPPKRLRAPRIKRSFAPTEVKQAEELSADIESAVDELDVPDERTRV